MPKGDLLHDKFSNGHGYKMLTVLDKYSRQALAVTVRARMGADDALETLYPLFLRHGTPEQIRYENGPEFVAEAMQKCLLKEFLDAHYLPILPPISTYHAGCS